LLILTVVLLQMEIQGQGFKLRSWKPGDMASLQKHADNINIAKYLTDKFPYPYTIDDAKLWINLMLNQAEPIAVLAIDLDGGFAGAIGLEFRNDIYCKTVSIGYWLGEAYWGRGIMPQAVTLMVDYTFVNFDIVRIQAGVFGNNPKSMRVLEKAGFTLEGVLKNGVIKDDVILDEHIYGVVKV
jgi:ribosomal-protein-alanine N-acetyltransferase